MRDIIKITDYNKHSKQKEYKEFSKTGLINLYLWMLNTKNETISKNEFLIPEYKSEEGDLFKFEKIEGNQDSYVVKIAD